MKTKLKILAVAAWYPSKNDLYNGVFIKEHLHSISNDCDIKILFVEGDKDLRKLISISANYSYNLTEIIVYYKIFSFSVNFFHKLNQYILYPLATLYGYGYFFLKFGKPELIHVHVLSRVGIIPLFLKLIFKIPYVISEQYTRYLPEDGSYKTNGIHHFLTKLIVNNSLGISAISKHLMLYMNKLGLKSKYQSIIPNVLNDCFLISFHSKNISDKLNIVHASTLNEAQKNFSGILKALKIVQKQNIPFTFHVYGGYEPYLSKAKQLAKQNPLIDVRFYGKVNKGQLAKAFANADVTLLFSNYETQGCVIFESLASGTPVIACDLEAIKEIINPKLGDLVERGNYIQLANSIINFKQENYDSVYLRNFALANFSLEVIRVKWLSFYSGVFNKNFYNKTG